MNGNLNVKQQPAFASPVQLVTRSPGEFNFLQEVLPAVANNYSTIEGRGESPGLSVQFSQALVVEDRDPIDSALLSSLENPRERMFVLNTENTILNFVKSKYVFNSINLT